jgi:hypothetical protein
VGTFIHNTVNHLLSSEYQLPVAQAKIESGVAKIKIRLLGSPSKGIVIVILAQIEAY